MFECNKTVDLIACDGRAKKKTKTNLFWRPSSQVQKEESQETKHNFFHDQENNYLLTLQVGLRPKLST